MKICDVHREEKEEIVEATTYCKSCHRDVCEDCYTNIDGTRVCSICAEDWRGGRE